MDIKKEREAFEAWLKSLNENGRTTYFLGQESTVAWEAWQAAKAQVVPETQQALNDRLLVESIREHVEGHISEISVNDLFDKGWLAAMKCIQKNIDMLEAREPAND
ncbi:hypothetical protein [Acinetobacter indicus]|uniref:hypothetical protein n=1 Tax=Acinetobacter indicus TaxID=756892 RepID=UPI0025780656|nr:hypothetical protein [Acinetobacter indicus]MDM1771072.1 hypothetical protein [Acinetobacter indicus]MDM1773736.1 hypothetical protein [Acinetobacter indicus]